MFKRLKEAIFGRQEKREVSYGSCINVKEYYELHREKITQEDWENQFQEYCDFNFEQNCQVYKIRLHFRESEIRKEEITKFVKDGMNATYGNLEMVILGVNATYKLGVATRGIQEGQQILLFFN